MAKRCTAERGFEGYHYTKYTYIALERERFCPHFTEH